MPRTGAANLSADAVRASVFAELQARIDARVRGGGELVPLQIGDTYLAPPPEARLGAAAGADEPADPALYRYGPLTGLPALGRAIAEQLAARGLPDVHPAKNILVGCGATHAIFCAARAALEPGDEVLLVAPYWPLMPGILRVCGASPVEVPLTDRLYADARYDVRAALCAALTPRTAAIYLITPNNPDGKVLERRHLEAVADVAREERLWVFADEVYADFAFDRPHLSIASLPGMAERTVTACSFSKSHALAGVRIGFVAGPERLVASARRVANHTVYNTPIVAQRAAVGALAAGPAWVAGAREDYLGARDAAARALEGSGARFALAEGGGYLFLDLGDVLRGRPLRALLELAIDHGVLLAPGEAFGAGYERRARLCYTGVPRDRLLEGIARLRAAIEAFG